jgi:hypothetical protein
LYVVLVSVHQLSSFRALRGKVKAFNRHDVGVTSKRLWLRKLPTPVARGKFGASCLPLALLDHRALLVQSSLLTMAPDEAIDILKVLVPIAKAVPILGAPVEGSLEALSKILEFAQVRQGSTYSALIPSIYP